MNNVMKDTTSLPNQHITTHATDPIQQTQSVIGEAISITEPDKLNNSDGRNELITATNKSIIPNNKNENSGNMSRSISQDSHLANLSTGNHSVPSDSVVHKRSKSDNRLPSVKPKVSFSHTIHTSHTLPHATHHSRAPHSSHAPHTKSHLTVPSSNIITYPELNVTLNIDPEKDTTKEDKDKGWKEKEKEGYYYGGIEDGLSDPAYLRILQNSRPIYKEHIASVSSQVCFLQ